MSISAIFLCFCVAATAAISVNVTNNSNGRIVEGQSASPRYFSFIAVVRVMKQNSPKPRYTQGVIVSQNIVLVVSATAISCDDNRASCDVFVGGNTSKTDGQKYYVLNSIV